MTAALFDAVNSACISVFAESFVYHGLDGDVDTVGIFVENIAIETMAGQEFSDATHVLEVLKADADSAGIEKRRDVSVRGIKYRIIGLQTDISGMVELYLRRYE